MIDVKPVGSLVGKARTAVILGSGLSALLEEIGTDKVFKFSDFGDIPEPTVKGHPGKVALYKPSGGKGLCVFAGRLHIYEGLSAETAGALVEAAASVGCERVLLVNAAGGLRPDPGPGSWILASEIMISPNSPSIGPAAISTGEDSRALSVIGEFRSEISRVALEEGVKLHDGVLMWNTGPAYETAAESRAARIMGADAVTMSIIPELVTAGRLGMKASVMSWITNYAPNVGSAALSHEDVVSRGVEGGKALKRIIDRIA